MSKCPYDSSIECDEKCRDKEFRRQLFVIAMGHGFWIRPPRTECRVQPWWCPCLAARQKLR